MYLELEVVYKLDSFVWLIFDASKKKSIRAFENKTDNLVQQITSKTNTKTSFFSQVHLVFLLNQVRTDDVKKKSFDLH